MKFVLIAVFAMASLLKISEWILSPEQTPWFDFFTSTSGLAVIIEVVLASWLLLATDRRMSWLISAMMLVIFCGLNLYWHLIGKAACECLGFLKIAPLWMLVIDLALLALATNFVPKQPAMVLLTQVTDTLSHQYRGIVSMAFALFLAFSMSVTFAFANCQCVDWCNTACQCCWVLPGEKVKW